MQLGIRGHDMPALSFEDRIHGINELGFSCTQLALKKVINDFNVNPEALTPGMAMYMKKVFAREEVDVAVLGCYFNLATPDLKELENTYRIYKAHIRFAKWLGCGVVGTETGAVNTTYTFEEKNHTKESLDLFVERLTPLVEYAGQMGVVIGIEPVFKHIVYNIDCARYVLDAIHSPNLQIIYDPINTMNATNYVDQEKMIEYAFEVLRDEISVVHVKDFTVEDGVLKGVPIGKGLFAYRKLLECIHEYKPYVHTLLEDTKPDNVKESMEYIQNIYRSL